MEATFKGYAFIQQKKKGCGWHHFSPAGPQGVQPVGPKKLVKHVKPTKGRDKNWQGGGSTRGTGGGGGREKRWSSPAFKGRSKKE